MQHGVFSSVGYVLKMFVRDQPLPFYYCVQAKHLFTFPCSRHGSYG